ncbi:MAG: DEAD/DEAH box helicase, partial [Akkermansia sp.]|nr:DEAD/DEAH box helicase [Akkermansia sp.]
MNISRTLAATAALFMGAVATAAAEDIRPNILFIISDDHSVNAMGTNDKDTPVPLPGFRRLADEGMVFDRAYCANSLCGPSRACMLTGRHSHNNGFLYNYGGPAFNGSQPTYPKMLQAAGYQTGIVGKWHLISQPTGFDSWQVFPSQGDYLNSTFLTADNQGRTKSVRHRGYVTDVVTNMAITWMESRDKTKPFALIVGHKAPHRNWLPAPRHSGKTAAFGLPLLQKVDVGRVEPQALILCPTRELCLQIAGDLNDYSRYLDGLHVLPVYGGSSIESQIRSLRRGVHVIVATPGRLIDLMERGVVSLQAIENVVMDEADEMLNMGFTESINTILAGVPEERNTLLFSATMSPEISRISKNYLRDAREIVIGTKNEGSKNVNHLYYLVHAKDKYLALKRIADYNPKIYAIIFCRTRLETQEIADKLIQDGYNADALHGELSQQQRD